MSIIGFFIGVVLFIILVYGAIATAFVFACRYLARSKGLPDTWMWFGLLGVIGILVVAFKETPNPANTFTYNQSGNFYKGGYVQNPQYNQQYGQPVQQPQYNQQYGQPVQQLQYNGNMQYQQAQPQQGYNLNGQQYTQTAGTICSFCGMQVSSEVKECPVCGSKVK